jgi:hypothetical protein
MEHVWVLFFFVTLQPHSLVLVRLQHMQKEKKLSLSFTKHRDLESFVGLEVGPSIFNFSVDLSQSSGSVSVT